MRDNDFQILACDCYDGCWEDHSANWHSIETGLQYAKEIKSYLSQTFEYGSYVVFEEIQLKHSQPPKVRHRTTQIFPVCRLQIKLAKEKDFWKTQRFMPNIARWSNCKVAIIRENRRPLAIQHTKAKREAAIRKTK